MIVETWLLVVSLYVRDAQSPVIVVPDNATQEECYRLGESLVYRHKGEEKCTAYKKSAL